MKKFSNKYIREHENELRQAIVEETKKFLGSRYHINGMVDYKACDCHTLLIMVYSNVGLIERFKPQFYRPDFSFHSYEETYLNGIKKFGKEVKIKKPGDIILYRYAKLIDHAAIVIDEQGTMIDSCVTRGCTIQDYHQEVNKNREQAIYSFWGNY